MSVFKDLCRLSQATQYNLNVTEGKSEEISFIIQHYNLEI